MLAGKWKAKANLKSRKGRSRRQRKGRREEQQRVDGRVEALAQSDRLSLRREGSLAPKDVKLLRRTRWPGVASRLKRDRLLAREGEMEVGNGPVVRREDCDQARDECGLKQVRGLHVSTRFVQMRRADEQIEMSNPQSPPRVPSPIPPPPTACSCLEERRRPCPPPGSFRPGNPSCPRVI